MEVKYLDMEQLLLEKNEEVESVNLLYNDQDKQISELSEILNETKIRLTGAVNERDSLKERVQVVTEAYEKTISQLTLQREEFKIELEDEKQKLSNKVALFN